MVEAPTSVAVEQEFAINVQLVESRPSMPARIGQAALPPTPEGALQLSLPPSPRGTPWTIDVVVSLERLTFTRGTNSGSIELSESGDSTAAAFWAKAERVDAGDRPARITVFFYHRGTFLAQITRELQVVSTAVEEGSVAPQRSTLSTVAVAAKGPLVTESVALRLDRRAADLTLVLVSNQEVVQWDILSPHRLPVHAACSRPPELVAWLRKQLSRLAEPRARGVHPTADTAPLRDNDVAKEVGRRLWTEFAPPELRESFWGLSDQLGERFRTIEIVTDDPVVPWEWMAPLRENRGSVELRGPLGTEFRVGRLHLLRTGSGVRSRPGHQVDLHPISIIAPRYGDSDRLPHQSEEVDALTRLGRTVRVGGREAEIVSFFQSGPTGIVHFAGHANRVSTPGNAPEYGLALEDGVIDVVAWRGIVGGASLGRPFIFFNACDTGLADRASSFVEGWAPAALESGASGFVGALWPVDDRSAMLFARAFYDALKKDVKRSGAGSVSEALRRARVARLEVGDASALAYVFYGDPDLEIGEIVTEESRDSRADR